MAGHGDGNDRHQRDALGGAEHAIAEYQHVQRQHRRRKQDVGHQLGREPRHAGGDRQQRDDAHGQPGPAAQAMRAQRQHDQPGHHRGLQNDIDPKVRGNSEIQKCAIQRRTAHAECAEYRPVEVAAGVGEDQRKAVPNGWRQQHNQHDKAGHRPDGAVDGDRTDAGLRQRQRTGTRNKKVSHSLTPHQVVPEPRLRLVLAFGAPNSGISLSNNAGRSFWFVRGRPSAVILRRQNVAAWRRQ